jgi:hypothetical protein
VTLLALLPTYQPVPETTSTLDPGQQATGWLTRHPKTLTEDEQPLLKTVLERCAELRAAAGHVRAFGELLMRLRGQELPGWIAAVRADGLPGLSGLPPAWSTTSTRWPAA